MAQRFIAALLLATALPNVASGQEAGEIPYFRFNFGTIAPTVGVPAANVNTDAQTGISVTVPCVQCRARVGGRFTFLPGSSGTQDYASWRVVGGAPPVGLVDRSTGLLQGVPPSLGTYAFRLGVHDSRNQVVTSPEVRVNVIPAPTVSYDSSQGPFGRTYAASPEATGVIGGATYQVTSGAIPDGLTLDRATGRISGRVRSSVAGLRVTLTDVDGAKATSAPFDIVTDLPSLLYAGDDYAGRVGVYMSVTPQVLNFGEGFKATVRGALPPGMTFDEATGAISGTPSQVGTFEGIVATGTDYRGTPVASRSLRFVISRPSVSYASATTWVGQDYRQSPTVSFFKGPSFFRAGGAFPDGLGLSESTGVLSGRPSAPGTFAGLTVLATDPEGALATSPPFQIKVLPALTASIPTPTKGRVGVPLAIQATSRNFEVAPTWTFDGTLPGAVAVNKATGLVSGTPSTAGLYGGITLTASQGGGSVTTNPFTVDVAPAFTLSYATPVTLPRGRAASLPATVSGELSAPAFARYVGTLPTGLSINSTTGAIEGQPTVAGTQSGIVVRASDIGGMTYSNALSISVVDPTASMASVQARVGQSVSQAATSTYLTSPTWSSTGTAPPPGFAVTAAGILQGTAQAVGTTTGMRMTATASDGSATTPAFQVQVFADLAIPAAANRTGTVATSLFAPAPTVTGLLGVASYALLSGGADVSDTIGQTCPGLAFSRTSAVISGLPSATCSVTLSYTVSDTVLPKTAQSPAFALVVAPAASTASAPQVTVQEGGTATFSVSTTIDNPTWSVSGKPDWMTFSASGKTYSTSSVSGDETQERTYRVVVTASGGGTSASATTGVTVTPATAVLASVAARPGGAFSADIGDTMTAGGTWSVTANPADVVLNAVGGGKLTGTAPPNATGAALTRALRAVHTGPSVTAGARAQAIADATLTIHPAFGIGAAANRTGQAGYDVSFAPPAPYGVIGTVTYELFQGTANVTGSLGSVCPGLTFSPASGQIFGRPTAVCTPSLSYKATDNGNGQANLVATAQSNAFALSVAPATVTPSTAAVTVNEGDTVSFTATTSLGDPTWTLTGNPSWMSVSPSGAVATVSSVSGDVGTSTTYKVRLVASSGGASATSGEIAVTVNPLSGTLASIGARGKLAFSAAYQSPIQGGTFSVSASPADVTSLAFANGRLSGVAPDVTTTTTRYLSVSQTGPAVTGGGPPAQLFATANLTVYPTLRIANPNNATESWQSDVGIGIPVPRVTGNAGTLSYALLVNGTDVSDSFGNYCRGLAFDRSSGRVSGVVDGAVTPSCDVTFSFKGIDPGTSTVPPAEVTSAPVRLVVYKQMKVRVPLLTRLRTGQAFSLTGVDDYTINGTWRVDTTPENPYRIQYGAISGQTSTQATFSAQVPAPNPGSPYTIYRATFYHYGSQVPSGAYVSSSGWGEIWVYPTLTVSGGINRNWRVGQAVNDYLPGLVGLYGRPTYSLFSYDFPTRSTGTSDISGSVPAICPGLAFDRSTGRFVGTPQAACSLGTVRMVVYDDGGDAPRLAGQAIDSNFFSVTVAN